MVCAPSNSNIGPGDPDTPTRSSELLLSTHQAEHNSLHPGRDLTFSTSTPARSRSPRPSLSFANPSPAPVTVLGVPATPEVQEYVPNLHIKSDSGHPDESLWETGDEDALATARSCLYSREFLRAAHLLRDRKSSKARFVRIYSQYLVSYVYDLSNPRLIIVKKASEKKALRDWHKLDSQSLGVVIYFRSAHKNIQINVTNLQHL